MAKPEKQSAEGEQPATFAKEQLVTAAKYAGDRDVLSALLAEEQAYTLDEVDGLLKAFYEGEAE